MYRKKMDIQSMKRRDREIRDIEEIEKVILTRKTCRVAMVDGDEPYVVPMNFGYQGKTVYLHGAKVGKKLNVIKNNPRICLEWDEEMELVTDGEEPCRWGMKFRSVIAWGTAEVIESQEEKIQALDVLMGQYSKKKRWDYNPTILSNTWVIKVPIDKISGKEFL